MAVFLVAGCCSLKAQSPCTSTITASQYSICPNSSTTLTASGATTYTWSSSMPSSMSSSVGTSIIVWQSGIYTVTAQSGTCLSTATVQIASVPIPTVTAISSTAGQLCAGFTTTLAAFGAQSYTWSGTSTSSSIPATTVNPFVTGQVGTYTVIGSNGGCTSSPTTIVIHQAQPLAIIVAASSHTLCPGGGVTLVGSGAFSYSWTNGTTTAAINPVIASPSVSTTYTVIGSTAACQGSATVALQVISPAPELALNVSSSSPTICQGGSATLTASGATDYYWTYGSASSFFNPLVVSPAGSTTFTVVGSNTLGCHGSATIELVVFSDCAMGIHKLLDISSQVSVSPNPGNGSFLLTAEDLAGKASIEVFDLLGHLIVKTELEQRHALLHLEAVPTGVYTVRITVDDRAAGYKRIIKN